MSRVRRFIDRHYSPKPAKWKRPTLFILSLAMIAAAVIGGWAQLRYTWMNDEEWWLLIGAFGILGVVGSSSRSSAATTGSLLRSVDRTFNAADRERGGGILACGSGVARAPPRPLDGSTLGRFTRTMLSKRSLRILIVTDLLLVALSVIAGIMGEASLPEPLRAYEEAQAEADMTPSQWIVIGVGIPLIIAMLIAGVGLLVFWRPARLLYLATIIVTILLTPLAGPYVSTGWAQAINDVSVTITARRDLFFAVERFV